MTLEQSASNRPPSRTAVFVDRDGVINRERRDYVTRWDDFCFLPGAVEALVALTRAGLDVIVITNQSAIHRGIVTAATVDGLHQRMVEVLRRAGGCVLAIYVCPHTPDEGCACRKPQPGLLLQAAREHGLDLARCYLIGDKLSDMEAGMAVGCRCLLVRTGLDAPPADTIVTERYRVFPSIREAVDAILVDAFPVGSERPLEMAQWRLEARTVPPAAPPIEQARN